MNAFLHAWTAFGFAYLISFCAEHCDADRDITGIEVGKISEHDFSNFPENWQN